MNEMRLALKVGLFVALGIVLAAGLLLIFSKGLYLFTPTYELRLHSANVGGLKRRAGVLLNGVAAGNVAATEVGPEGRGVIIRISIVKTYAIHSDARFAIEQIGLLGDQYIAVYQQSSTAPLLKPGDTVEVEEPLNIENTLRSANSLIQRVDETVEIFNKAISRVDRTVLSEKTLTNVDGALDNFRSVSDKAKAMADHIGKLIDTNAPSVSRSISNLVQFSEELQKLTSEMSQTVTSNRVELTKAVKSLQNAGHGLQGIVDGVEGGKGVLGSLVKDEQLRANFSHMAANLANLSSNLNRYGLLYKPKQAKDPNPHGKSPFEK